MYSFTYALHKSLHQRIGSSSLRKQIRPFSVRILSPTKQCGSTSFPNVSALTWACSPSSSPSSSMAGLSFLPVSIALSLLLVTGTDDQRVALCVPPSSSSALPLPVSSLVPLTICTDDVSVFSHQVAGHDRGERVGGILTVALSRQTLGDIQNNGEKEQAPPLSCILKPIVKKYKGEVEKRFYISTVQEEPPSLSSRSVSSSSSSSSSLSLPSQQVYSVIPSPPSPLSEQASLAQPASSSLVLAESVSLSSGGFKQTPPVFPSVDTGVHAFIPKFYTIAQVENPPSVSTSLAVSMSAGLSSASSSSSSSPVPLPVSSSSVSSFSSSSSRPSYQEMLVLEDVTQCFARPCVIDVKMGRVTFDPLMASAKKRRREVEKYPLQAELGFRITSMKVRPCVHECA